MAGRNDKWNLRNGTYTVLWLLSHNPEQAYPAKVAALLSLPRNTVLRHFKSMQQAGLITCSIRSSTNIYVITEQGRELLKVARRVCGNGTLFRWHDLVFKLPVLGGLVSPELLVRAGFGGARRGFLRGWEGVFGRDKVFFTGKSFLVFAAPISESCLTRAIEVGLRRVEVIGERLCKLFPVRLHYRAEVCRQEMALVGGISNWVPERFSYRGDVLLIDFSTGRAEVETFGKFSVEGMYNVAEFLDDVAKGGVRFREVSDGFGRREVV